VTQFHVLSDFADLDRQMYRSNRWRLCLHGIRNTHHNPRRRFGLRV
jgi:hypothetical protein